MHDTMSCNKSQGTGSGPRGRYLGTGSNPRGRGLGLVVVPGEGAFGTPREGNPQGPVALRRATDLADNEGEGPHRRGPFGEVACGRGKVPRGGYPGDLEGALGRRIGQVTVGERGPSVGYGRTGPLPGWRGPWGGVRKDFDGGVRGEERGSAEM